jgi:hypothetical protein
MTNWLLMKKGLLALLFIISIGISSFGQTNVGPSNDLVNLLKKIDPVNSSKYQEILN